jgi:hypothetical protein
MPRFHCEFKNCFCKEYILPKNKQCSSCGHANIWHSRKNKNKYKKKDEPPSDAYLQFASSRKCVRKPKYIYDKIFPRIFTPRKLPIAIATPVWNPVFCEAVHLLDV